MELDSFLLPCPVRYFLGMDCPGCGLQRALVLALGGQWKEAFALYPPWPLVMMQFLVLAAYALTGFKWNPKGLIVFFIFTGIVVYLNYFHKIIVSIMPYG